MTRLELAKLRFRQLAPGLALGADEERSEDWEKWLRDEVVPVVEDLNDNPVFRRHVSRVLEQLFTSPPTDLRARINALADSLVSEAQTLVTVARQSDHVDTLADSDWILDHSWLAGQTGRSVDSRSAIEKLAERPWFDVVNPDDFWTPGNDLYLRQPDALLTRQYRRLQSGGKLLGEHVINQMFQRFDFWKNRLMHGQQQLQLRLGTDQAGSAAHERIFACAIEVEQKFQAVQADWRAGNDARLREACIVLLQTYIAYHEAPQLAWLGFDSHLLMACGQTIRSFFRHRGTLHCVERKNDGRLHQLDQRTASLVDVQLIQQVAAALEDLATVYHQEVHANDLIAEAKDQFRLLVVVNPRMVFWNGALIDVPWTSAQKSWNLMLHLAVKTEGKLPIRDFALTGIRNSRDETIRKSHLLTFLSRTKAGAELAVRICKPYGEACRLDIEPADVKVLDLDADEWTVDVNDFLQTNA